MQNYEYLVLNNKQHVGDISQIFTINKKYKSQAWGPSFGWKLTYPYKMHPLWFQDLNCKQIGQSVMIGHAKKNIQKEITTL